MMESRGEEQREVGRGTLARHSGDGGGDENGGDGGSTNYDEYLADHLHDYLEYQDWYEGDTMARIRQNDPSITKLTVHGGDIDSAEEGALIGENSVLRKLELEWFRHEHDLSEHELIELGLGEDGVVEAVVEDQELLSKFVGFMEGLARNRFIEGFQFRDSNLSDPKLLAAMSEFFIQNNNLRSISLICSSLGDESIRVLASALARRCNKTSIVAIYVDAGDVTSASANGDFLGALVGYCNLKRLSLTRVKMGDSGCDAMTKILQRVNIEKLELHYCGIDKAYSAALGEKMGVIARHLDLRGNPVDMLEISKGLRISSSVEALNLYDCNINNKGAYALGDALCTNTNLKTLRLDSNPSIQGAGWRELSKCMLLAEKNSALKLQTLDISGNKIDNVGIAALSAFLVQNCTLKAVNLSSNRTEDTLRWENFAQCLRNPDSALEELNLENAGVDSEGAAMFGKALSVNTRLKILNLGFNDRITDEGWEKFFRGINNPGLAIEELVLRCNNIKNIGACADSLANMSALAKLDLSFNRGPSSEEWRGLTRLLQSPTAPVKRINLYGSSIGDDTLIAFAAALAGNTNLRLLRISSESRVSARVCEAFTNLVYNKSSIQSTWMSNHTIRVKSLDDGAFPDELMSAFKLNKKETKAEVARQKILQHHFLTDEGINVQGLIDLDMKLLPRAIAWVGKGKTELSLLYRLLQGVAFVFELPAEKTMGVGGMKRKRESLLLES